MQRRVRGGRRGARKLPKGGTRLGGDAPDVEAGAAQAAAALHAGNLQPQLTRPDGGHVAAGPAADDNHILQEGSAVGGDNRACHKRVCARSRAAPKDHLVDVSKQ